MSTTDDTTMEIKSETNRAEATVTGDNALETLRGIIDDGYLDIGSTPNHYHVAVAHIPEAEPADNTDTHIEHDDSGPMPRIDRGGADGPGANGGTGPQHTVAERSTAHTDRGWTKLTDSDREEGDIPDGTSYHAVLYTVWKHGDDGVRWSTLVDENPKMVKGTIAGALSTLWQRKLVERYESTVDGNHAVFYTISDHGQEWLNEHPPLTIGAWADQ